jgi:hypothetical protein
LGGISRQLIWVLIPELDYFIRYVEFEGSQIGPLCVCGSRFSKNRNRVLLLFCGISKLLSLAQYVNLRFYGSMGISPPSELDYVLGSQPQYSDVQCLYLYPTGPFQVNDRNLNLLDCAFRKWHLRSKLLSRLCQFKVSKVNPFKYGHGMSFQSQSFFKRVLR